MKKNIRNRSLMVLWSCAALLATQLPTTAQTLTHRYTFWNDNGDTNAVDAVGTANGTFEGDIAGTTLNGGHLALDGSGYVQLPTGIITNNLAVTVEAWADYPATGQGTWANLFDFGTPSKVDAYNADSHCIAFCVNDSGTGNLDAAICDYDDANNQRQATTAPGSLLAGLTGAYVAVVVDPPSGLISIYVNGALASQGAITETITPGVDDNTNWIGWDNWHDPSLVANIDEFRIWNGALNGLEIAASYQNGFATVGTNAGTVTAVQLSAGAQVLAGGVEVPTITVSYSLITNTVVLSPALATYTSGNTNIVTVDSSGFIHGIAVGTTTVTASYGGQSSSAVTVTVIPAISVLAHRYSFNDTGTIVKDSVGTLDGNLMGTAYETNGQVVLDGSVGCYVDLGSNSFANDGIITGFQSATVDFWATFGTLQVWNYAWAFGNSSNGAGSYYIHNVVRQYDAGHRIDDKPGSSGETVIDMLGDFANETVHCTTVIDPTTGQLAVYTNGVLSGLATNDYLPLAGVSTNFIYIGRSLWTALGPTGAGDPYLAGSFDEIRVYNGALLPPQIALADLNGPNNTNINVGNLKSIQVSIPKLSLGDQFLGGVLATYANLTNFNLLENSRTPLMVYTSSNSNVVYQAADGKLHAVGLGSATVTAIYGGFTNSGSVLVTHEPVLVNRYSFQDAVGSSNVADSVGGPQWNGVLPNGGTFTGTNLQLSASGPQYVLLPPYILKNYPSVTVDMWVSFPDPAPVNCMLFAFGNTDTNGNSPWNGEDYIFCAPVGGRIAITGADPGYDAEQGCAGAGDFTTNPAMIHLTAVFDPPGGAEYWYTNGVLVSSNLALTTPMSYVDDVTNYICHSLYTADPHEDLTLTEFRIYNGALTAADVAAEQILGPSVTLYGGTPTLTHRYSFHDAVGSTNAADSVGGAAWNGTLPNGGTFTGGATGTLTLNSTNTNYVSLPPGVIANGAAGNYTSLTIDTWVTAITDPGNSMLYAFGNTDSGGAGEYYLFGSLNRDYTAMTATDPGWLAEQGAQGGVSPLPLNQLLHITGVYNPPAGYIAFYTNGALSAANVNVTDPMSVISDAEAYIGRSVYNGDPYASETFTEFRIFDGALTSQEVAIADKAGPSTIPSGVTNGPGAFQSFTLQAPSTLQWLQVGHLQLLANYTGLTGWDLAANSVVLPPGWSITSSDPAVVSYGNVNQLTANGIGTVTITASYQSVTQSVMITVVPTPATLVHEYSFHDRVGSTTVADSIGGSAWNGTLPNGGTFTGGSDGNLSISTTGSQYVKLPSGVIQSNGTGSNYAALTIDSWATATYLPANCMYYAFGNTDTGGAGEKYLFGSLVRDYTAITAVDPGWQAEQGASGSGVLPLNQVIHFTGIYNPPAGYIAIYTNGVLSAINQSVTDPLSVVSDAEAFIGRSLYSGDPYGSLTLYEFRIYNGALSAQQVAASQNLGPAYLLGTTTPAPAMSASVSSGNLVISWPVSGATASFTLYSSSTLGPNAVWTPVSTTPTVVGDSYQITIPTTGSAAEFFVMKN